MYDSTRSECLVLIKSTIVRSVRGFITYLSASYHPALDQQHRADMLQVPARIAANAAGAFQLQGKRWSTATP